jgi:glycosyltransferase involved in cell wall biosynthesis
MAKVSVIIPAYNQGKYICEAVESVLRQTYTDFELVVVDDGSTDNTREVIKQYLDTRLIYVYQENR